MQCWQLSEVFYCTYLGSTLNFRINSSARYSDKIAVIWSPPSFRVTLFNILIIPPLIRATLAVRLEPPHLELAQVLWLFYIKSAPPPWYPHLVAMLFFVWELRIQMCVVIRQDYLNIIHFKVSVWSSWPKLYAKHADAGSFMT